MASSFFCSVKSFFKKFFIFWETLQEVFGKVLEESFLGFLSVGEYSIKNKSDN